MIRIVSLLGRPRCSADPDQLTSNRTGRLAQETLTLLGSIIPIIAIVVSVNIFLASEGVPQQIAAWLQDNIGSAIVLLLCLNLLLLLVGCLMDTISALLIFAPLLMPVAAT